MTARCRALLGELPGVTLHTPLPQGSLTAFSVAGLVAQAIQQATSGRQRPVALEDRVTDALESVRPYLESHGGSVELVGVDGAVVRLRLRGSAA